MQAERADGDDIVAIDMEGKLVEGTVNPPLEFHLHTGIYRARADVKAVVHAHPKWSTFLTMVGESYRPVFAQGVLAYPVPVLDTPELDQHPARWRTGSRPRSASGRRR